MSNDRFARYGAATGILAVILLIVGFMIFGSSIPDTDASGQSWANFFREHEDRVQLAITVAGVGLFFFIWFLGSLRSAIATAEGGAGRLASIAFGGGIVGLVSLLLFLTGAGAAAFRASDPMVDPNLIRALMDFGAIGAAPGAAGLVALFAATAIAGYRFAPFPPAVAGLSALAAIGQALAYGVVFTDHGPFAADGVLGLVVPVITFGIAVIALSVSLIRQPTVRPAAP